MLTLSATKREALKGAAGKLRKTGAVPAVVYGAHQESTPISVEAKSFAKIFREAGEATIVSLTGLGEAIPTLIHEVDLDPLTSQPRHVDFYAVTKGQKVEVAIPLSFINESPAVKEGANLVKVMHELEVKADPMALPHSIEVDLAKLEKIGDQIRVSDLVVPAGVEVLASPEDAVALVQEIVEEKVEEAPVDLNAAIEVEKKGKEEGAEGEATAAPAAEEKK